MNPDNSDGAATRRWPGAIPGTSRDMTKRAEAAVVERDGEKRAALYEALERDHQKNSPFVIMFQQIEVAAHRKSVDGFILGPSFGYQPLRRIVKH